MARTPINVKLDSGNSYTVGGPGKIFVGKAFPNATNSSGVVTINAVPIASVSLGSGAGSQGPLAAQSGDVFSCPSGSYSLSGFEIDV